MQRSVSVLFWLHVKPSGVPPGWFVSPRVSGPTWVSSLTLLASWRVYMQHVTRVQRDPSRSHCLSPGLVCTHVLGLRRIESCPLSVFCFPTCREIISDEVKIIIWIK